MNINSWQITYIWCKNVVIIVVGGGGGDGGGVAVVYNTDLYVESIYMQIHRKR